MARDLWNIEKEFERMKKEMNQLMNSFLNDSFDKEVPLLGLSSKNELMDISLKTPSTDIYETEKEIIAEIEVPGAKKEDIKLKVKNGILSLKVETKLKQEDKDEKKGYHRIERHYSGFAKSFSLPVEVDEAKVKANYKDGILKVHMPKKIDKNEDKIKYINVE